MSLKKRIDKIYNKIQSSKMATRFIVLRKGEIIPEPKDKNETQIVLII